jgi:hypothetical protein
MVRLSQLVGNHRQPSTLESSILLKELSAHLPDMDLDKLINTN